MSVAQDDSLPIEEHPEEPVPKVRRTYGRKKDALDASHDAAFDAIPAFRTRFVSSENSRPPGGSDMTTGMSDDASDTFGWREKLALIDKQFDEEEGQKTDSLSRKTTLNSADKDDSLAQSTSTESSSPDLHDGMLLSSFMAGPSSSQSDPPSPGPSELKASRAKVASREFDELESVGVAWTESPKLASQGDRPTDVFGDMAAANPFSEDEQRLKPDMKRDLFDLHDRALEGVDQNLLIEKSIKGKQKERVSKIKKLSNKEEKESKKAHARMMADQKVSITKRAEQYTVEHLLDSVRQGQFLTEMRPGVVSSDPIQDFTSSPSAKDVPAGLEQKAVPSAFQTTSDEEMPDMQDLLTKESEQKQDKQSEVQRRKSLALAKRRALERLKVRSPGSDSEGDDLEVIAETEEQASRRTKATGALEKKLATVAGFHVGSSKHSLSHAVGSTQADKALKLAAKSTFDRDTRRTRAALDHRDLQTAILSKATKQSMQLTKEKEEEWKRRGGKLAGKQRAELASKPLSLGALAENLALTKRSGERTNQQAESEAAASDFENSSDEEWRPHEGESPSPRNSLGREASHIDEEPEGLDFDCREDRPVTMDGPTENEDEDAFQPVRQVRRTINRPVLSDSEDEKAYSRRSKGRVLVPETSVIINDAAQQIASPLAEDGEENKENDTSLVADSSDDKENFMLAQRAGVSGPTFGSRQHSRVFDLEDGARQLSISPTADAEDEEPRSVRKPLQARKVTELDDPFVLRSPSSATSSGTPKSKRTLSAVASPISLKPAFDGNFGGFTQLFNDEEGVQMGAPSKGFLQPAFHLRLGSDAENSPVPTLVSPKLSKAEDSLGLPAEIGSVFKKQSKYSARDDEFSLTLDTKLQPHLDITSQFRRRADAVFEKEQDFLMEEASTSATSTHSKQELYVSENGLLTQTKPEGSTPLLFRSWPSPQKPNVPATEFQDPPSTTRRLPLSTLSILDDTVSPSQERLTRLIKGKGRAESSDDGDMRAASLTDRPSNAFARLLDGAKRQQMKERRKLVKSHLIEGEAIESDEDELFGFGQKTKNDDDEESDDDDADAVVENLVDDRSMDAEELAEESVLEKVKEQLEEDDVALQKYHEAAVEGKYRGKRRGGRLAMDDSESDEDEDEEARRLRRRMHKKRRIQGDKLEDLRKDEKSRAFYEAYQRDIQEEDNDDFAHLANDEMDDEDEDNEEEQLETVSTAEIREQLRQAARQQKDEENTHHIEDVVWSHHANTSDDEFEVKEIDDQPRRTAHRRPVFGQIDVPEFDDVLPRKPNKLSEEQAAQLDAWRKEQSSRNVSTGGMRGAITVTGHGSKSHGRSVGPLLKQAPKQDSKQSTRRKITKTGSSVLASVSDKHSRFGL